MLFIEITTKGEDKKPFSVLLPLMVIRGIYQSPDGTAFVEVHYDREKGLSGFDTVETYEEVINQYKSRL